MSSRQDRYWLRPRSVVIHSLSDLHTDYLLDLWYLSGRVFIFYCNAYTLLGFRRPGPFPPAFARRSLNEARDCTLCLFLYEPQIQPQ